MSEVNLDNVGMLMAYPSASSESPRINRWDLSYLSFGVPEKMYEKLGFIYPFRWGFHDPQRHIIWYLHTVCLVGRRFVKLLTNFL
ncbi:MAG: hypothetical protein IPN42_08830 [Methylococcaceae bacterium]|nr:hypothetical protein [Methylococcaceae bacterium]